MGNQRSPTTLEGMRAVILAGGRGTRLYPYTATFPKPLVPLGQIPIIEVLVRQLLQQGICDITLALGHLAELIKTYFQQNHTLSTQLCLRYVQETEPSGTAGALALVPNLDSTFLVMNGDLLTNLDYAALVEFHKSQNAQLTIATYERKVKIDLGVLQIDSNRRVVGYLEKPEYDYQVSMGVYVYEPEVMNYIRPHQYLDLPTLVVKLLEAGCRVSAFPWDGLWLDIGRPDDYGEAQRLFQERPEDFGFGPGSISGEMLQNMG